MSTSELATYEPPKGAGKGVMALRELDFKQMMFVGDLMFSAGMFNDLKTAAQAQVKVMAGQELGLAPMQSMNAFHIIHGRVTLAANTMAAKVLESGRYRYRHAAKLTDEVCILEFQTLENGKWVALGLSDFSAEDAKKAGTQNMGKFPRNMLFARALSNGVKWFCPDVFGMPVYVEGEIDNITTEEPTEEEQIAADAEAAARLNRRKKLTQAGMKVKPVEKPAETPETPQTAPSEPEEGSDETTAAPVENGSDENVPHSDDVIPTDVPEGEVDLSAIPDAEEGDFVPHSPEQRKKAMAILTNMGFKTDSEKRQVCAGILGMEQIVSFKDLSSADADLLIKGLTESENQGEKGAELLRGMFVTEGEDNATTQATS